MEPDKCEAPPDEVDILLLRSWGVPKKKAADILYKWRQSHIQGRHDICVAFDGLREDLALRKISFYLAEGILLTKIKAREFDVDEAYKEAELAERYRPWESIENNRAFFKELRNMSAQRKDENSER